MVSLFLFLVHYQDYICVEINSVKLYLDNMDSMRKKSANKLDMFLEFFFHAKVSIVTL